MANLDTYRRKRDFTSTREPEGEPAVEPGWSFVVQKHAARRLHYDFRLEMDGVLKSWAVTRGPSLDPREKRLAVHVEDHPLAYGDFEGTIPKGQYGGGTVVLWDRGTWAPIGDARRGYDKGHIEFDLRGEKLHGRWHLVRMHGRPGETRENWLLIKADDEAARPPGAPDVLDEGPESVKTGRSLAHVTADGDGVARQPLPTPAPVDLSDAPAEPLPAFVEPALATLAATSPRGSRWLHEIKFDGYRVQARIDGSDVRLLTRTGLDWTAKFGVGLVDALRALPVRAAVLDGELVVADVGGASDFAALQSDLGTGRSDRMVYWAFDLLHLDGRDLRRLPLIRRKEVLGTLLAGAAPEVRFSDHFDDDGDLVMRNACRLGLEGVVSKRRDAPYRSGRGKSWIKSKCSERQEFVIGGWVPSTTSAKAIGSLVLGVYEDEKLQHVGRVGTGFSAAVAADLFARLAPLQTPRLPFATPLTAEESRGVRPVRPELVAEVEFRGWTGDHHLRHGSFRGLREDKPATEIRRETPMDVPAPPIAPRRTVRLTHPDRLYWPDEGVTKEGLVDYLTDVWPQIAPFVTGRPLALLRCPSGITGPAFFQKHGWKGMPKAIRLVSDPADPSDEPAIVVTDLDGLLSLAQSAVLEIHPRGASLADWERPDQITMDLDPGEGVGWDAIIAAAEEIRDRLASAGLAAFVKTSGGKGLHVVAPLTPQAEWPAVKDFTRAMAEAMARDAPDRYVATIAKAKRGGKILIDYLRNQRGATAVAPYSTRARPGAAVSMPLGWDELGPTIGPAYFTVANTPNRIAALERDPWADFRAAARPLPRPKR